MRPDPADRPLRSVAAELSELDDDDVQAILGGLDPSSRQRLQALIARYREGDRHAPPAAGTAPDLRLSDWLTSRLSDATARGRLTPRALAALDAAAADAGWRPTGPTPPRARGGLRAWLGWRR